jgi:hypothetical protein
MKENAWTKKLKMADSNLVIPHIHHYISLWIEISNVHLHEDEEYKIVRNLAMNGEYFSSSAYKAQFFRSTLTFVNGSVWKA